MITDILIRHQIEQINFKSLYEPASSEDENAIKCSRSLMGSTVKLYSRILEYQIRLAEQCYNNRAIATIRNVFQLDSWGDMTKKLQSLDKRIIDELRTQKEAREQIERRIQELHPTTRATWARIKEKPICHEGTQREIRDAIHRWSEDSEGKSILWLSGLPGTGKSTVLRTIAAELSHRDFNSPRLGASFFFNKNDLVGSNIRNLFPTLACDLVETVPGFGAAVSQAIGMKRNIQDRSIEDQWRCFIQDPLLTLKGTFHSQIIVVLDAIDEIVIEDGTVGHLLQRLSETERLKFLISCRSESPVPFQGLGAMVQERKLGKIIVDNTDENDITCFLTHELAQISEKFPDLPPELLGQETVRELAIQTEGLFFYADSICRLLKTADRGSQIRRRLEQLTANKPTHRPLRDMDKLYTEILDRILTMEPEHDEEIVPLFQKVVGAMVVLRQPLSVPSLGKLIAASDDDSDYILAKICSLIDICVPGCPPSFIHLSFKDYVLDGSRCPNRLFHITKERRHAELFRGCIKVMKESLHREIRNLHDHRSTVDAESSREQLPQYVRYACMFWVEHLSLSGLPPKQESYEVEVFVKRHFLQWLEFMAWLKMIPDADVALVKLYRMRMGDSLRSFLKDAWTYIQEFRGIIEKFPLQIYVPALIFCSEESCIRNIFEREILREMRLIDSGGMSIFGREISFRGDQKPIEFQISPDGQPLVVVLKRLTDPKSAKEITIWDTTTWVSETLHVDVLRFQISPSSRHLLVLSQSGKVFLSDLHSRPSHTPLPMGELQSISGKVTDIAFFESGARFACAVNKEVLILSATTGHDSQSFRVPEVSSLNGLSVAADGSRVARLSHVDGRMETIHSRDESVQSSDITFETLVRPQDCQVVFPDDDKPSSLPVIKAGIGKDGPPSFLIQTPDHLGVVVANDQKMTVWRKSPKTGASVPIAGCPTLSSDETVLSCFTQEVIQVFKPGTWEIWELNRESCSSPGTV
ncbi:uncharacterized protein BO80DRAFT_275102 [Aspergillus ibericus CBS 121593]|uniref:NACHT domain-containing protein n=1 Tax=Aspergillus ibericus CBS 121593 TaxID=1448316 RepID=A0A395GIX9_9EURO|nr:hypothetical protein BO80DRAFT_275102 [Aspergillus ibericus CBS 121593]RAK95232.1 hypothetical protein BO80DRAFT_275102 [Aspergillus ibericus CBS 121593]